MGKKSVLSRGVGRETRVDHVNCALQEFIDVSLFGNTTETGHKVCSLWIKC